MFSDISNHWAQKCILALGTCGIVSNSADGMFQPNAVLSRAEFATLMTRVLAQLPTIQECSLFDDITAQFQASRAIDWANQRGLFRDSGDGSFRPYLATSRLEAILVLMAGWRAGNAVTPVASSDLLKQQFSDAADIPPWATETVAKALAWQLLEQLSYPRPLCPNQPITRGEVAALLCRALSMSVDELTCEDSALAQAKNRAGLFQQFLQQEASFDAEKLAYLDGGIAKSPYQLDLDQYVSRLTTLLHSPGVIPLSIPSTVPYPNRGEVPPIDDQGLGFLSPDMLAGCLCLSTRQSSVPGDSVLVDQLHTRWLGRLALQNRQMWSATKFVPLLNVLDRVNAIAPNTSIDRCWIRDSNAGSETTPESSVNYCFADLATSLVNYDNRMGTSNALAAMFKNFETPARLERWMRQITGNDTLSFQGRYGEAPFIESPQLWDSQSNQILLAATGEAHQGENLVSPYDLTRLITMMGWHAQLSSESRFPAVQNHSLEPLVRSLGNDTARYVDIALKTLGLTPYLQSPVIISKCGFGRSDLRDRTELTYCALVQFSLPRAIAQPIAPDPTAPYQQYAFGFTLMAAKDTGDADDEARYLDALMAAEVTELLRRVVADEL